MIAILVKNNKVTIGADRDVPELELLRTLTQIGFAVQDNLAKRVSLDDASIKINRHLDGIDGDNTDAAGEPISGVDDEDTGDETADDKVATGEVHETVGAA